MARGRPPGALNRKTREALHAVKESQLDGDGLSYPVRYLLSIVKNPKKPEALRVRCADLCAPYTQPKLSAIDLTNSAPAPIEGEDALKAKLLALIQSDPHMIKELAQYLTPGMLETKGEADGRNP